MTTVVLLSVLKEMRTATDEVVTGQAALQEVDRDDDDQGVVPQLWRC